MAKKKKAEKPHTHHHTHSAEVGHHPVSHAHAHTHPHHVGQHPKPPPPQHTHRKARKPQHGGRKH